MINSLVDAVLRVAPSKKSGNFVKGVILVNPEVEYSLVDTSYKCSDKLEICPQCLTKPNGSVALTFEVRN